MKYLLIALALLVGCSSGPEQKEKIYSFYPNPPAQPRIQYLTTIHSEKQIKEKEGGFTTFLLGEDKSPAITAVRPYGVGFYEGKIYICDLRYGNVLVFNFKEKKVYLLEDGRSGKKIGKPINIYIYKGYKYITDIATDTVAVYNENDKYVKSYKGFKKPSDVLVVGKKMYVSDTEARTVYVVDRDTNKVEKQIDAVEKKTAIPTHLARDSRGRFYVSDTVRGKVAVFTKDFKFIKYIGKPGIQFGNLNRPKGLAIDKQDSLYVIDTGFHNCQIFLNNGKLATFFGNNKEFIMPTDIFISYKGMEYFKEHIHPDFKTEYLIFVANQGGLVPGGAGIAVYAFGKGQGSLFSPSANE